MAIAKSLQEIGYGDKQILPEFVQKCPLCQRDNRMVVFGNIVIGSQVKQHVDMGYSFCNCQDIFYTRPENVTNPASYFPDENGVITLPDPFFAWPNPYDFHGWDVRQFEILWDMEAYVEKLKSEHHLIDSYWRDMNPDSITPQTFHIKVKNG